MRLAKDREPDLMLLDLHMPGGGLSAASEIAKVCPNVRVIMLTTSSDEDDVLAARKVGVLGYLLNGIPGRELLGAVRDAFSGMCYRFPRPRCAKTGAAQESRRDRTPGQWFPPTRSAGVAAMVPAQAAASTNSCPGGRKSDSRSPTSGTGDEVRDLYRQFLSLGIDVGHGRRPMGRRGSIMVASGRKRLPRTAEVDLITESYNRARYVPSASCHPGRARAASALARLHALWKDRPLVMYAPYLRASRHGKPATPPNLQ